MWPFRHRQKDEVVLEKITTWVPCDFKDCPKFAEIKSVYVRTTKGKKFLGVFPQQEFVRGQICADFCSNFQRQNLAEFARKAEEDASL